MTSVVVYISKGINKLRIRFFVMFLLFLFDMMRSWEIDCCFLSFHGYLWNSTYGNRLFECFSWFYYCDYYDLITDKPRLGPHDRGFWDETSYDFLHSEVITNYRRSWKLFANRIGISFSILTFSIILKAKLFKSTYIFDISMSLRDALTRAKSWSNLLAYICTI